MAEVWPWGHLSRASGDCRHRSARRGPLRVAHQPRRRRHGRERHASGRRPGSLESVRTPHRRRDRGGDRLRTRHRLLSQAVCAARCHHAARSRPATSGTSCCCWSRSAWSRSARRSGPGGRSTWRRSGWLLFLVIAGSRSQLDPAAPVQVRGLAVGPAGARSDRYRAQLQARCKPRRPAAALHREPARQVNARSMGGCSHGATRLMLGGTRFDE